MPQICCGEFIGYKVLVDYDEVSDKLENRIYHCLSITIKTDDGYEVKFGKGVITYELDTK